MTDAWQSFPDPAPTALTTSPDPWAAFPDAPEIKPPVARDVQPVVNLDSILDKKSGAPMGVRQSVGGAPNPADRLATLRKYYPEAIPYGDDNFAFRDPKSGNWRLYNPKGLDFGDVMSVTPELFEGVGGLAGALFGGPPGAVAGATAAKEVENLLSTTIGNRVDNRGLGEHLVDTGVTAGMNAVGGKVGEWAGNGIRAGIGYGRSLLPGSAAAPAVDRLADFTANQVTPTIGAATGNRTAMQTEQALSKVPLASNVVNAAREEMIGGLDAATQRVAGQFGPTMTTQGAGGVIRQGAERAAERFNTRQDALYDVAYRLVGRDTPTPIASSRALSFEIGQAVDRAPESLGPEANKALNKLAALMRDADTNGGNIPFDALRQIHTDIGRNLKNPVIAGSTGAENAYLKRVYGALSEDIGAATRTAGPDAARAMQFADDYTRVGMNGMIPLLQKIRDTGTDEAAYKFALSLAQDGGSKLTQMRTALRPDEWNAVAGTVLGRMGRATPGVQGANEIGQAGGETFSASTFLTNWNKLAPEAKTALFGGTQYAQLTPALNSLLRVIGNAKDVDRLYTPSGANAMAWAPFLALGAGGQAFLSGSPIAGAATMAGAVAPYFAAQLITHPPFVRWLAAAPSAAGNSANGLSTHAGRLATIAFAEPELEDAIDAFREALRPSITQSGSR